MNDHKATRGAGPPPVADVHLGLGTNKCCAAYKFTNASVSELHNTSELASICHPPKIS